MAWLALLGSVPVQVGLQELDGAYHLVLVDTVGGKFLMMGISESQALAISIGLLGLSTPRPLTHDLFLNTLRETGWELERVEVVDLREGAYIANLMIRRGKREIVLDSRPSDAVALAVRAGCPIYAEEWLLDYFMENLRDIRVPLPSVSI